MKIELEKEKMRQGIKFKLSEISFSLKFYSLLEADSGSRYEVYRRLYDMQRNIEDISRSIHQIEDDLE